MALEQNKNFPPEGFRLSPQQKHLWLLQQSSNTPYWAQCQVLIEGELERQALHQALQEVVNQHEILRTTFPGLAAQRVLENNDVRYNELDLSAGSPDEIDAQVAAMEREHRQKLVDLEHAPLFHATLFMLAPQKHLLLLSLPAVCSDGTGLRNLVQEISRSLNREQSQNELIQYADLAEWQNGLLESSETKAGRDYWQERWYGLDQSVSLFPKLPFGISSGQTNFDPQYIAVAIPAQTLADLDQDSLFNVLLVCWQILLWRLTGQAELFMGVAYNGRKYDELKQALGLFATFLPVRCQLAGELTFSQVLDAVDHATSQALEWQEFFGTAPDQLGKETFFPTSFEFAEWKGDYRFGPGKLVLHKLSTCLDRFDLKLSCLQNRDGLIAEFHYNASMFSTEDIRRLASYYQTMLAGAIRSPNTPIADLEILSQAQRHQLLIEFNDSQVDYPQANCIHQLFEAQVERTPDVVAVVFEGQELTYRELNARANQLAHHLRDGGVKPDMLVGICFERCVEMVVAVLGVLKAGGAYVPLDPTYPEERLAFILQDIATPILISQTHLISRLPQVHQVLCLDSDWPIIARQPSENLPNLTTSDNLAYAIYTSGSTGQSKGVMVEHHSPINLLTGLSQVVYRHHPGMLRASLNAPLSFDASMQQLILLLRGYTLHIIPQDIRTDGQALLTYFQQHDLDVFDCTPSQLRILLAAGALENNTQLPSLFLIAGETVDVRMWKTLQQATPSKFFNIYGPTECTVDATACHIQPDMEDPIIGYPLANYQLYVLDNRLRPQPMGVVGELYVGGPGLARGYIGRPDLTADKFVPHPFSLEPGHRLYKTGDLVRYQPDGSLEFLGRIDTQVKLRGYRIELGEIESVLEQHPTVHGAVVIVREDIPGDSRLVAYIVPSQPGLQDVSLSTLDLQSFLQGKLPLYMLPSAFVILDAFPLTHNSKVDRRALPAPEHMRQDRKPFEAPQTAQEKILAEIWSQALNVERVSVNDSYFALGGDSIRSLQVITLARKRGLVFSLDQLFRYQTIRELAQVIQIQNLDAEPEQVKPYDLISVDDRARLPADIEDAYPLSWLQAGVIFHCELNPETAIYQDVITLHLRIPFDLNAFQMAVEELTSRHPVLRTSFDMTNYKEPLQLVHRIVQTPLSFDDIRESSSEEQEEILTHFVDAEKHRHFAWDQAPFIRYHIHLRTNDTVQLTLTEHHVILDGWSAYSMLTELFQHYLYRIGRGSQPIASPVSLYSQFVAMERQTLNSKEALDYWDRYLAESTVTTLAGWPSSQTFANTASHSICSVPISVEISTGLKNLAQSQNVHIKSVLLAAHMRTIGVLSGQADVVTGLITHTRPKTPDAERILGLFVNSVPFRSQLANGTWIDLIQETFKAEVEMMPFQALPLAQMQKRRGGQVLFEILFNFTHFHVYESVQGLQDIEILGGEHFNQDNSTLGTDFEINPLTGRVQLTLNCNGVSEEQLAFIGENYVRTLAAMVDNPAAHYGLVSLLSDQERALLNQWNATAVEYDGSVCIHELFEAQVAQTPDALAVTFLDERITYQELNQRANQLAHHLQKLGVQPEIPVGICLNRSVELIVGILGVLKAGGAYVPLDPKLPVERLGGILEDTNIYFLLLEQSATDIFQTYTGHHIYLDDAQSPIQQAISTNPRSGAGPANTVYIIYTSGSTGKPKGVAVSHHNLVNAYYAWNETYQLETKANVHLQMANFAFDVFSGDLVRALCSGGKLVLCPSDFLLMPSQLYKLMCKEKVDIAEFVPAVFRNLIEYLDETEQRLDFMRILIVASDKWYVQEYKKFVSFCGPDTQLINSYGLTETTIDSTYFIATTPDNQPDSMSQKLVPIGKPFANVLTYILDTNQQLVPEGIPGELYIGGAGLARGYVNRPDLTAERFMPDPFKGSGERLYKTGDLARYLPDGNIEYLGRIDQQVKIRGYRIELGEIETTLRQHPVVRDAVVVYRQDTPGIDRLVGYVVAAPSQSLPIHEILSLLRKSLPEYMVPSVFVSLDALPLTPNGKLDRKALPVPEGSRSELQETLVAPRTPMEQVLADIWVHVLGVDQVGVHDNFFELGGHSLLATQVVSRIRQVTQVELSLRSLFEKPTIAELADIVDKSLQEQKETAELEAILREIEGLSDNEIP